MKKIIATMFLAALLLMPFRTHAITQEEYHAQLQGLIDQLTAVVQQLLALHAGQGATMQEQTRILERIDRHTTPMPDPEVIPPHEPVRHIGLHEDADTLYVEVFLDDESLRNEPFKIYVDGEGFLPDRLFTTNSTGERGMQWFKAVSLESLSAGRHDIDVTSGSQSNSMTVYIGS